MSFAKLVDSSALLSKTDIKKISDRKTLNEVLKKYLDNLFKNISDDSKLFWATFSFFAVKEDRIGFCNNMYSESHPLFEVNVEKSENMNVRVGAYKIDNFKEYVIDEKKKIVMNYTNFIHKKIVVL